MKFKNLFVVFLIAFAIVSEPILAQSTRRSSGGSSSSSRGSSSSSGGSSRGWGSSSGGSSGSKSPSSGGSSSSWGGSSSSKKSTPSAPSSPSSSWGSSSKKSTPSTPSTPSSSWGSKNKDSSSSGFSSGSSDKSKSSGWANESTKKKEVGSSPSSTTVDKEKSSGWGTASPNTGWGTSKKVTDSSGASSYRAPSKAEVALERKAIQSGTAFKSKEVATSDFKTKYADKYPSKFTSEPSTRPDYIPRTYSSGGNTYNVVYNGGYGGYGYFNALGAWIVYDAMSDALMMNSLMHRNNYYYPAPSAPYIETGGGVVVQRSNGTPFVLGFLFVFGFLCILFLFAFFMNRR